MMMRDERSAQLEIRKKFQLIVRMSFNSITVEGISKARKLRTPGVSKFPSLENFKKISLNFPHWAGERRRRSRNRVTSLHDKYLSSIIDCAGFLSLNISPPNNVNYGCIM